MAGRRTTIIGIDATAALTQGGGIGRYTRELVRAVVAEAPGYNYALFTARPPAAPVVPGPLPVAPNVRHRPAPVDERWLYRLWYRARLPLTVQTFTGRLDLFHSPDFVLPPVGGSIPTLLTVHDLSFVHYPATFPPNLVRYLNRVVPWSVGRATHVLADSHSTRRDLAAVWNVPESKVTVLHSGVNDRFRPVSDAAALAALRERYNLGDRPYILAVGTVQPRKNYEMLVRAFRGVAGRQPHNLVIAGGKGWLMEGLAEEIARQGLSDRVRTAGFVADEDLPALYSAADLFVFPSLYEGFGLPLLEAMACGVAVISSNASSLPEVTETGGEPAALLLPPDDESKWTQAMLWLLEDDGARQRLIAAGREQAARFTWRASARQLAGLYGALLGSPGALEVGDLR